jgi:hypothetical protein
MSSATKPSSITDWIDKIKSGALDLMTLDVLTLTGTLTLTSKGGAATALDPTSFFESLQGQVADGSSFTVVALTHKEVDLDAMNFIAKDLTAEEKDLLSAHADLVRTSEEGRLAFLKMLGDLVELKL